MAKTYATARDAVPSGGPRPHADEQIVIDSLRHRFRGVALCVVAATPGLEILSAPLEAVGR